MVHEAVKNGLRSIDVDFAEKFNELFAPILEWIGNIDGDKLLMYGACVVIVGVVIVYNVKTNRMKDVIKKKKI